MCFVYWHAVLLHKVWVAQWLTFQAQVSNKIYRTSIAKQEINFRCTIKCENISNIWKQNPRKMGQQTLHIDSTENLPQNMVLKSMFSSPMKYSAQHNRVRFHLLKALIGEALILHGAPRWCTTSCLKTYSTKPQRLMTANASKTWATDNKFWRAY